MTDNAPRRQARILRNSEPTPDGCWLWTGWTNASGYGIANEPPRNWLAHRLAYTAWVGEIPTGLELDHLCKRPPCVNPDHLEPVTRAENIRRRYSTYATCTNGHPFDDANTYVRPNGGGRDCRACMRARSRKYYRGQREAAKA